MCAGLEGGAQFLRIWTKRNSIRLDGKDRTSPRGLDIEQKAKAGWRFALSLLEGDRMCSVSGRKATYAADCSWVSKSVVFSSWAHRKSSLLGSTDRWLSSLQWNEWKRCMPISGLSHKNLPCAVSCVLSLSTDWLQIWQEDSRASVPTWAPFTLNSGDSMNLGGKSISLFSLSLNWNSAFLYIMNADNQPP